MVKKFRLFFHMLLLVIIVAFTTVICVFAARGVGVLSEFTISYISPYCFLVDGDDVNVAMKQLVNSRVSSATTVDSTIEHIVFDFYDENYENVFNWETDSSRSVDATENANIRLFYDSQARTMYVLSYNLIAANDCNAMFRNFSALQSVDFKNFNSIQSTTHENMFYGDASLQSLLNVTNLNTNLSTTTQNMFYGCTSLETLNLSHLRTEVVTTMNGMFKNCSNLAEVSMSHFDVGRVTDFSEMFYGCADVTSLNLSNFSTRSATTMKNMFYGCTSLSSANVSGFETTLVSSFEGMFQGCSSLTSLNLSSFNSVNAESFKNMFSGCSSLATLDISNMVSDSVTDMTQMFAQTALTTLDLAKFDTTNVTTMDRMFYNMPNITTIYASNLWTTMNVSSGADMFTSDTQLVGGFGTTYSSSHTALDYAHVDVLDGPGYLTAADVQYKGLFIADEYGTQLSVSYVGSESPYTLPVDEEFDYLTCNSVNYQPGSVVDYSIFDGVENVNFVAYYKKATLTFTNGTNGSYVNRSATYTHKGQTKSVSSGGKVPYTAVVTVTVSVSSSSYRNPVFTARTASGRNVELTTISQYSQYSFTMPNENVTATFTSTSSGGFCVAEGTLVTLEDGTTKKVEDVTLDDRILIFNHETGAFEGCEINFIESEEEKEYSVVNLVFSNGVTSRIIYEHGFFDLTLNKYVYIHDFDCTDFVGHTFLYETKTADGFVHQNVTLVDAFVTEENTRCYSLTSKYHLNLYTDGLLSMPGGIEGMFNIFEYDVNLKYDETDKENSIAEFGLFTYEEFEDYITYEQFCLYPAEYLKVSLGKGLITWEFIEYLISRYC